MKRQMCFSCGIAGHIARNCKNSIHFSAKKKKNSKAVKQAAPKIAFAKRGATNAAHQKTRSDHDWNVAKQKQLSKQHRKYFVHFSKMKQNTFSKNVNGNFRQRKSNAKSECKFESHLQKPPISKLIWVPISH